MSLVLTFFNIYLAKLTSSNVGSLVSVIEILSNTKTYSLIL